MRRTEAKPITTRLKERKKLENISFTGQHKTGHYENMGLSMTCWLSKLFNLSNKSDICLATNLIISFVDDPGENYLGKLVDKHGLWLDSDSDAAEALLSCMAPRTNTQLMSFLGFANYTEKIGRVCRKSDQREKSEWNENAQAAFDKKQNES